MFKKILKILLGTVIVMGSVIPAAVFGDSPKIARSFVQEYNGNTSIMIDYGNSDIRPYTDLSYMTYVSIGGKQNYYERMAKNGSKAFHFMVTLADSSTSFTQAVWRSVNESGKNVYDWSQIDNRMENILKSCPDAIVTVQVFTGAPGKWLNENDDACVMIKESANPFNYSQTSIAIPSQRYPSVLSKKYREQSGLAVRDVISHVESKYGGNVVGYIMTGMATEEWYHHGWHNRSFDDFNPDVQTAFQAFVMAQYGTIEKVRAAWGKPASFTEADIEVLPPELRYGSKDATFYKDGTGTYVADFYRFYNEMIPDTIGFFADQVKTVAPEKVVGCFYGYQLEFSSDPGSGHNALGRLLKEKSVDFIKVSAGALDRFSGTGGDNIRAPLMSGALNNKVIMNDNDSATSMLGNPEVNCFSNEVGETLEKRKAEMARICGYAETPELSGEMLERIVMFASANGFLTTYFDLHGGYYAHPVIEKYAREIEQRYKTMFEYNRSSAAQLLVVADEKSCDYVQRQGINGNGFLTSNTQNVDAKLIKLGVPYDLVLTDDIDKVDMSKYKMVWFINNYYVSAEQKAKIDKFKGDGRTILWSYAPGIINESGFNIANASEMTGISLQMSGEYTANHTVVKKSDDPLVKLLFAEKYSDVEEFEEHNGNMSEQIVLNDPAAVVFGYSKANQKPQSGYRAFDNWKSVIIPNGDVSVATIRGIMKFAGVHIYEEARVDKDVDMVEYDTVYANNNMLVVHANGDGERTLKLPRSSDVYDALTKKLLHGGTNEFKVDMPNGYTETFLILPTGSEKPVETDTRDGDSEPSKGGKKSGMTNLYLIIIALLVLSLISFQFIFAAAYIKKRRLEEENGAGADTSGNSGKKK